MSAGNTGSTILALDFGMRQIGVAVGNTVTGTSEALSTLGARDGVPQWQQLAAIIAEWQPQKVLVGLPLNMDGSEGEMCVHARRFGNRIHGRFGVTVEMVDERLSSAAAKQSLRETGHRGDYHAAPVDAEAARLILAQWLTSTS